MWSREGLSGGVGKVVGKPGEVVVQGGEVGLAPTGGRGTKYGRALGDRVGEKLTAGVRDL